MKDASFLRTQEEHFAKVAAQASEKLAASDTREQRFLQEAAESYQKEVRRDLQLLSAETAGELLDLRVIGPRADGSLPLEWFFKIAEPLTKAWEQAAQRLRFGLAPVSASGRQQVQEALNLRLAGMAVGSTRIFVTGNALPDLTGESLFNSTLKETFRLMSSSADDFYDAVDAVGGDAARQIGECMKALNRGGFAAEITWNAPDGRTVWRGQSAEVVRLLNLIEATSSPQTYTETLRARVSGIRDTGRLDLRSDAEKLLVRFPLRLTPEIQRLTLNAETTLQVRTAKYWDAVGKRDVFRRQLVSIEDIRVAPGGRSRRGKPNS